MKPDYSPFWIPHWQISPYSISQLVGYKAQYYQICFISDYVLGLKNLITRIVCIDYIPIKCFLSTSWHFPPVSPFLKYSIFYSASTCACFSSIPFASPFMLILFMLSIYSHQHYFSCLRQINKRFWVHFGVAYTQLTQAETIYPTTEELIHHDSCVIFNEHIFWFVIVPVFVQLYVLCFQLHLPTLCSLINIKK